MVSKKRPFQYYIGIGLVVNAFAYLLFEGAIISDGVKLFLYLVGISLEIFGLIQYRKSCIQEK